MKQFITASLLLLSMVSNAETVIYDDRIEQRRESLTLNKVIFVDHDLNRIELVKNGRIAAFLSNKDTSYKQTIKVSVQKVGAKRSPTHSLEVWSVLKNHTDFDLQVEGRAIFFDADEVPLNDRTAWKRLYIPANSFGTYRDFSVSPLADYFVVELREGK